MALQVFTAGQTLTAAQMTTLQASTYNYTLSTISASTYTVLSSDAGKLLLFTNNATPVGVTFPASLGMAVGDTVEIVHGGTGTLTLIADAGVTLNSEGSLLSLTTRYARVSVTKTASNVFLVSWMTSITEPEIATSSVTSDKIANDTIVNADINTSAAIAHSKLANTTAGNVLIGTTTTGVITGTAVTGDVTITGAGVTTIGTGAVTSEKLGTDLSLTGTTKIEEIFEKASVVSAQPVATNGGTLTLTITDGSVYYYTVSTTRNVVLDIVTTGMITQQAVTVMVAITSGSTAGKISEIKVNGVTNTAKWFGGNLNPNGSGGGAVDAYTITIFRNVDDYTVFASQSKFA